MNYVAKFSNEIHNRIENAGFIWLHSVTVLKNGEVQNRNELPGSTALDPWHTLIITVDARGELVSMEKVKG